MRSAVRGKHLAGAAMAETLALHSKDFYCLSMASDDELKDEELVDFEGSDYELDGDYEELEEIDEEEDEVGQQQPTDLKLHGRSDAEAIRKGSREAVKSAAFVGFDDSKETGGSNSVLSCRNLESLKDSGKTALACEEALEAPQRGLHGALGMPDCCESQVPTRESSVNASACLLLKASESSCQDNQAEAAKRHSANKESSASYEPCNKEKSMESGKIEGLRHVKDKNAISGLAPSSLSDGNDTCRTEEHMEDRLVKLSKPDLEDGELDESPVPQKYGFEEAAKDETVIRERKRRKESFATERQVSGTENNGAKQVEETLDPAPKHRNADSDKPMEQFVGLSAGGGRGGGFRIIGLGQGSLAPGIMGPGRPLLHLGMGSIPQGFGPFGVIAPHGRPQVHLQEVLAQEHLLRAHALQLAQETLANAIRSPLVRPLNAAAFQPYLGFDVLGPRSHTPKQFPRPPLADLMLGHNGNLGRGQRPILGLERAGVSGKIGGQTEPTFHSSIGRQFGWSAALEPNELQSLKRGRDRGRGLRAGPWGDAESFGPVRGGLGNVVNPRAMLNLALTSNVRQMNPEEAFLYQTTLAGPQDLAHNGFDARWKIEKERMLRNGSSYFRLPESAMIGENYTDRSMELDKEPGKLAEGKLSRLQSSSRLDGLAARLGPPAQAKAATVIPTSSGDLAAGSNVIKLLQPVRKSRILTVSGLPEDTPMSTVAEVFEKLGKITDFKKSSKGDTFTISYSNETEAVTAKRNLHRSCLAGKQITVDYVHQ